MSASSSSSVKRRRNARRVDGWPPRFLTPVTRRSDGPLVAEFIETFCAITKDTVAGRVGDPITVQPWQRKLLAGLFCLRADGHRKHRQALVGVARKNGKSAKGAGIALYGLLAEDAGAEVYSCAADRDQAKIVFGTAKRMVELSEELSQHVKPYRDVLEVPSTGSIYRALSAEAYTKEGLSPTLVVFDEVHAQPNDELWNVMTLGSGARVEPLVLGITTAGARTDARGRDSLCYRLYQHGKRVASGEVDDPSFFFAWWEPKRGAAADHRDPKVWREANPGLGTLISEEDFHSVLPRTPEAEFRTKRTNVFVVAKESALPHGAWESCSDRERVVEPHADAVLGFDGSYAGDSTGLVGCTPDGHLFVIDCWEPADGERVPIAEVEETIRQVCRERYTVSEVACDPYRWQRSMEALADEGLPIVEWPTGSVPRIVPAWKRFYDAVMDHQLTHDGDQRLARHIENMVLKRDMSGVRPVKESATSGRKIDLGIAAVIAYDRATAQRERPVVADYFTI